MSIPESVFYFYLDPSKIELTDENIQLLHTHSEQVKVKFGIEDKFNVLCINASLFNMQLDQIDETIHRIKRAIKSSDQTIVLWAIGSHTHLYSRVIEKLNEFSLTIKNPIIYFTGALPTKPLHNNQAKFTISPLMYFEFDSFRHWNQNPYIELLPHNKNPITKTKKFTSMGTKDYPNRKFLLSHIINNNLLDQGYVSYKQVDTGNLGYGFTSTEIDSITKVANSIDHLLPLPTLDDSIEWIFIPRNCLLDSYVNIVTDTFYATEPDTTFISEKVFNSIAHWQMFIMMAPPYTLQYLRDQGYQTFSPYINETYDTIENNHDRLLAVTKSFIDFVSQPAEVLEQIYKECLPIVEHNRQRLVNNYYHTQLNLEIQRAINEKV
jgi:hypothetical protein